MPTRPTRLTAALAALALAACSAKDSKETPEPKPALEVASCQDVVGETSCLLGELTAGNATSSVITLTNTGPAELLVSGVGVLDGLAGSFSIVADTCTGNPLASDESCVIEIHFAPATAGSFADTFSFATNDPDAATVTIDVAGSAHAPPPALEVASCQDVVGETNCLHGEILAGTTTTSEITLTNIGLGEPLVVSAVGVLDGLASPFEIVDDTCTDNPLALAESCVIGIRFAPTTSGPYSDTFSFATNDPAAATVTIHVSGSAVDPTLEVASCTDDLDWNCYLPPQAPVGTIETSQLTLTNIGPGEPLVVSDIGVLDGLASPFSIVYDTCTGNPLALDESCILRIQFAPTAVGSVTDTFSFATNDPTAATVTIPVAGDAAGAPAVIVTTQPGPSATAIPFGTVPKGVVGRGVVAFENASGATAGLTISAPAVDCTFDGTTCPFEIENDSCTGTLAPGVGCSVFVRFAPTTTGTWSAHFTASTNDYAQPMVSIDLAATATLGREVLVGNAGASALADFQVLVTLDTEALIDAGSMRADCADLRFVGESGLRPALPYWIEPGTCGTATTRVWVLVPSLRVGDSQLHVAYGDPSAAAGASGAATFEFFDDFEDGSYDGSWTVGPGASVVEEGGLLKATQASDVNGRVLSTTSFTAGDAVIEARASIISKGAGATECMGLFGRDVIELVSRGGAYSDLYLSRSPLSVAEPWFETVLFTPRIGEWNALRLTLAGSSGAGFVRNEGTVLDEQSIPLTDISSILDPALDDPDPASPGHVGLFVWNAVTTVWFDDFRVRKYAAVEPTAAVGPEL